MSDEPETQPSSEQWGEPGLTAAAFAAGVKFDRVYFCKEKREILSNVTFELLPREIICLVGPSGCGKTSILRLLGGAENVSSGSITIDHKVVSDVDHFVPPEKRRVGMVFQDYALFPHLTVIENIQFGLNKIEAVAAKAQAANALERVGLSHKARSFPSALSGGEQQRVALARSIAPRPSILLLDEAFSSLDKRLRDEVRTQTLSVLRETRSSCIIVTHDPEEALSLADRLIVMRQGRIVQIGTPDIIYHQPVDYETAVFFSQCTIIEGERIPNGIKTVFGILPDVRPFDDVRVKIALRLHSLEPCPPEEGCLCLVKEKIFEGAFSRIRLIPQGLDLLIWVRIASDTVIKIGDIHNFKINPLHTLLFDCDLNPICAPV